LKWGLRLTTTSKIRILSFDDGHPTGIVQTCSQNIPRNGHLRYGDPPTFVNATDRWAKAPDARQAYSDVLDVFENGFGLINAKYLDLKSEMMQLNAILARLVPSEYASIVQRIGATDRDESTPSAGDGSMPQ
jgi:hypothetical protein